MTPTVLSLLIGALTEIDVWVIIRVNRYQTMSAVSVWFAEADARAEAESLAVREDMTEQIPPAHGGAASWIGSGFYGLHIWKVRGGG